MKSINIVMLLLMLSLSVINKANAEDLVNLAPSFTHQDIEKSINKVIDALEQDYLFPEKSKLIVDKLKYKLDTKEFNQIDEVDAFINELSLLMRNISGDGYLNITQTKPPLEIGHTQMLNTQTNAKDFSFKKVEILPGNIGYLKLNYFYQNSNAELQAAASFDYLSGTDAIIIDLRDVEGDSISLAQYMMSFFVESDSLLIDVLYDRQTKTQSLQSAINTGEGHFKSNFPVYLLTSSFTSSTGEFLSYTLQHLNKAVIVGEQTMGVALISEKQRLTEFISISMPIAMPIHPVTNTNWEQEGVIPDFKVEANASFDVAYKLAKTYLGIH